MSNLWTLQILQVVGSSPNLNIKGGAQDAVICTTVYLRNGDLALVILNPTHKRNKLVVLLVVT